VSRAWALVLLALLMPGSALSDSSNLEGGAFIAHHPPGLQYTSGQDWCARYFQEFAIDSCSQQNNRIDLDGNDGEESVWFVLAAWDEEKEWCGTEFGFADYDSTIYVFDQWGPCPSSALAIPTPGWPGPDEGIALSLPDMTWMGNLVPVFWFAGYAYDQGTIPLAANPASGFGGTANCATPPQAWPATSFGAMGIFQDGTYACPEVLDGGGGLDGGMQPDGAEGYGGYEPDGGSGPSFPETECIHYEDYMRWIGNVVPGTCYDVAIAGDYAFVASGLNGLQVVNIANPGAPTVEVGADTPGEAYAIALSGNYAYVADRPWYQVGPSLQIVNVSDPENPSVVGDGLAMPGDPRDVVVYGDYAFVVINTPSPSVQVVDVTVKTDPEVVAVVELSAPWGAAVSDDGVYLYVADNLQGLRVIDVSNRLSPQIVATADTPGYAHGVALSGSYAYGNDVGLASETGGQRPVLYEPSL